MIKSKDEIMLEMMTITLEKVLSNTSIEDQENSKKNRNWELYNKLDELNKIRYRIFEIDNYTIPIWLENLHKQFDNK
jgi:hypothetical protein